MLLKNFTSSGVALPKNTATYSREKRGEHRVFGGLFIDFVIVKVCWWVFQRGGGGGGPKNKFRDYGMDLRSPSMNQFLLGPTFKDIMRTNFLSCSAYIYSSPL